MDRVLITGAAGFLGFHIAKSLVLSGVSVFCCDNFIETSSIELKRARAKILELMGVKIEVLDVTCRSEFMHFLKDANPTHVLHLANAFHGRDTGSERRMFDQHVDLFWAVLESLASLQGNNKLVFSSSSEVYNPNLNVACKEWDATFDHQSIKASALVTCESLASTFFSLHGVESMGIRFFDVYGPWGNSADMKYYLYAQALLQDGCSLSAAQLRQALDLVYIDDAVDGMWTALQNVKGARVMNVGSGRLYSSEEIMRNFSETILQKPTGDAFTQAVGAQSTGEKVSSLPGVFADLTFSQSLGYNPQTTLRSGVEKFVGWYVSRGKDFAVPTPTREALLSK